MSGCFCIGTWHPNCCLNRKAKSMGNEVPKQPAPLYGENYRYSNLLPNDEPKGDTSMELRLKVQAINDRLKEKCKYTYYVDGKPTNGKSWLNYNSTQSSLNAD